MYVSIVSARQSQIVQGSLGVRHRKCRSMGVKVPDFTSHMPMLHSSRTFSLPRLIIERHEETSAHLPKLVRASTAPHRPIHLSVTSQTERDITSTFNLMYAWHGVRLTCFAFYRANSIRPCVRQSRRNGELRSCRPWSIK